MINIPDLVKKSPLDVHFNIIIKHYTTALGKPRVAILAPSMDNKAHYNVFRNIDGLSRTNDKTGMSQTFDQSTDVYAKANVMFNQFANTGNYSAPVAVIEYPKASSSTPSPSSSSNGSITDEQIPEIDKAVDGSLFSGILYIVPTKDVPEKDLENLSDFTYTNQHIAIVGQFTNVADMQKLDNHVKSFQTDKNKLHNVKGIFEASPSRQPVAEGAAYAAYNLPQDWKKIGNLSQFKPTNITAAQMNTIESADGAAVVDRADDYMFSNGKAMGGGYLDQFVNSQFAIDDLAHTVQHFLDHGKDNDDDSTRSTLRTTLQTECGELKTDGIFVGNPIVSVPSRAQQSGDDAENRVLNGVNINADVYDPIEKVNGTIALTV